MAERKKTNDSLTLEDAFLKLVTVIQTIELRQSVDHPIEETIRPHEAKRIQYAFNLIHGSRPSVASRADERREKYRHFLLQLRSVIELLSKLAKHVSDDMTHFLFLDLGDVATYWAPNRRFPSPHDTQRHAGLDPRKPLQRAVTEHFCCPTEKQLSQIV